MKRLILSALCCLLMLSVLSMTAVAVEVPDLDSRGSISIAMSHQGTAVPGGTLTLYRVAEVHVENGADYSFRYTGDYADCQVSLDALSDAGTAQALAEYTTNNNISGVTLPINGEGNILFTDLELGLYLLVQHDPAPGYEPVNPFLVSVPGLNGSSYIYHVDASPKVSPKPEHTEPTCPTEPTLPTEPLPPSIPQTGLTQWPVPVLAIGGLLIVVLGLALYTSGKKRSHES